MNEWAGIHYRPAVCIGLFGSCYGRIGSGLRSIGVVLCVLNLHFNETDHFSQ